MQITMRESGGRTWARTKDPLIKSQLLYQLSYASIAATADAVGGTRRRGAVSKAQRSCKHPDRA